MPSIFSQIIQRKLPCHLIAENDEIISFLDIAPLKKGHCLVVPKYEIDKLFHLPKTLYQQLLSYTYQIAQGIEKAIPCNRVSMIVLGLEVPHAHIHLIPIDKMDDANFDNPKLNIESQEMQSIAQRISAQINL